MMIKSRPKQIHEYFLNGTAMPGFTCLRKKNIWISKRKKEVHADGKMQRFAKTILPDSTVGKERVQMCQIFQTSLNFRWVGDFRNSIWKRDRQIGWLGWQASIEACLIKLGLKGPLYASLSNQLGFLFFFLMLFFNYNRVYKVFVPFLIYFFYFLHICNTYMFQLIEQIWILDRF